MRCYKILMPGQEWSGWTSSPPFGPIAFRSLEEAQRCMTEPDFQLWEVEGEGLQELPSSGAWKDPAVWAPGTVSFERIRLVGRVQ